MKNVYEIAWNLLENGSVRSNQDIEKITGLKSDEIEGLDFKLRIKNLLKSNYFCLPGDNNTLRYSFNKIKLTKEVIESIENDRPVYLPNNLSNGSSDDN